MIDFCVLIGGGLLAGCYSTTAGTDVLTLEVRFMRKLFFDYGVWRGFGSYFWLGLLMDFFVGSEDFGC